MTVDESISLRDAYIAGDVATVAMVEGWVRAALSCYALKHELRQDLVQDTHARLLTVCDRFNPELSSFKTFAKMLAGHVAVNFFRVGKPRRKPGSDKPTPESDRAAWYALHRSDPFETSAFEPDEAAADTLPDEGLSQRLGMALESALSQLSPDERQILQLRADGMPFKAIGEMLSVSQPAARQRFKRVRDRAKGLIQAVEMSHF